MPSRGVCKGQHSFDPMPSRRDKAISSAVCRRLRYILQNVNKMSTISAGPVCGMSRYDIGQKWYQDMQKKQTNDVISNSQKNTSIHRPIDHRTELAETYINT